MEILLDIIFYLLSELLGPLLFEFLSELGIRSVGEAWGRKSPKNPILACIGYLIVASLGGAMSLGLFPHHFIQSAELRMVSLIITPLLIGFFMSLRGRYLTKKGKKPIRLDSFVYGFLFAFTFSFIRFYFGSTR